jgi:hypothetical protein
VSAVMNDKNAFIPQEKIIMSWEALLTYE